MKLHNDISDAPFDTVRSASEAWETPLSSMQRGGQNQSEFAAAASRPVYPGEAVGYPRKSTATERAAKSIEDQADEIKDFVRTCGFIIDDEDIWPEVIGHGGDEFWRGGGGTGLQGDTYSQQRYRPTLTRIMEAIIAGKKSAIVVWSQDRLWRDVEICDSLIKFCLSREVRLFDRNGLIDIYTPEGRSAVRNNAIAAAHYRELCAVRSPMGIRRSAAKGVVVTDSNRLGFRSGGRYSRKVLHVSDEQAVVRRIFRMFVYGESRDGIEHGPMSMDQIAKQLQSESYQWTPDLAAKRSKKRNVYTQDLVYDWQIKQVLTDRRYIGIQQRKDKREGVETWTCSAYLTADGSTVVDPVLFEAAQEKLNAAKRSGFADRGQRALTGLIRCGLCGQGLNGTSTKLTFADGHIERPLYWKNIKYGNWAWCTHSLPSLRVEEVDAYIDYALGPLLTAQYRQTCEQSAACPLAAQLAETLTMLREAERRRREELPLLWTKLSSDMLQRIDLDSQAQIAELKKRLESLNKRRPYELGEAELAALQDLSALTPEARRDLVRSIIRWVAVLPNPEPREPDRRKSRTRPPRIAGRLVILCAWGTYHTAVIERPANAGSEGADGAGYVRSQSSDGSRRILALRPARPDEIFATVADFPSPEEFLSGLKRAYEGRKYQYDPVDVMPGYETSLTKGRTIPEFEVEIETD